MEIHGSMTGRIKSNEPNYHLVCRQCGAHFSPDFDECPHCSIIKNDEGLITKLPQAIKDDVHEELVKLIENPGKLKIHIPAVFRRAHRNLFQYSHRRLILTEEYLNRVHEETLRRLSPEQLFKVGLKLVALDHGQIELRVLAQQLSDAHNSRKTRVETDSNVYSDQSKTSSNSDLMRSMLKEGKEVGQIAKELGVRYQQVYQIKKRMEEKGGL